MNNADLVWHLVELLLQQGKYKNQVVLDQNQIQNDTNQDEKKQNEA